jgi:hypothetical protein
MASAEAAVADIFDGAAIIISGFGTAGMTEEPIDALIARGVGDLTIISNNAGNDEAGVARADEGEAGEEDHLLLSAPAKSSWSGAAGQPCRAYPGGGRPAFSPASLPRGDGEPTDDLMTRNCIDTRRPK